MNDDSKLYLAATQEVDTGKQDPALWAKVMTLAEGDQEKAKYKYITLRVEQFADEENDDKPVTVKQRAVKKPRKKSATASKKSPKMKLATAAKKTELAKPVVAKSASSKKTSRFDQEYIPITEFSEIKNIPENKIIEMIRDGFYVGQIKNEKWYVSRKEISTHGKASSSPAPVTPSPTGAVSDYISIENFAAQKGLSEEVIIEMVHNGDYAGRSNNGVWEVKDLPGSNRQSSAETSFGNKVSKLFKGDYGLPKTYWLFGVLGNILFFIPGVIAVETKSISAIVILFVLISIYMVIVMVGIWRASNKYQGPFVWVVLARLAVILGVANTFGPILIALK